MTHAPTRTHPKWLMCGMPSLSLLKGTDRGQNGLLSWELEPVGGLSGPVLRDSATLSLRYRILRDTFSGSKRTRDDNKNKICAFQGGLGRGAGRKIVQNAIFQGKRHDNKILKVKFLLSRNFVVMAQAPREVSPDMVRCPLGT